MSYASSSGRSNAPTGDQPRSEPQRLPGPGVRAERQAAAAQIGRTMKAWRSRSGPAGASSIPQGGGTPLSADVRKRMEPKLGANLGDVKVHTGGDAAKAANDLGARAFTVGSDVHFNAGQFAPGTKEGDRLIAHELTHVVQGQKSGVQRKPDDGEEAKGDEGDEAKSDEVSDPEEPAEKEADAVADDTAEKLHGDKEEKREEEKEKKEDKEGEDKEKPAPIAAKLEGINLKIWRAPLPAVTGAQNAPISQTNFNAGHPHMSAMGIATKEDLGPYQYFPARKTFDYKPADLADKFKHVSAPAYKSETVTGWDGVTPGNETTRKATALANFPGDTIKHITAHNNGDTPRTFTSVAVEDTNGAHMDAHNVERHVISGASEMKSAKDVALRAGFGMIGGVVTGAYPNSGTATAFNSLGDANTAVSAALGQLSGDWEKYRAQLAAGNQPNPEINGPAPGGGVTAYNSPAGQRPVSDLPGYLGGTGPAPLYAGDPDWQTWWDTNPQPRKDYEAANGTGKIPDPITVNAVGGLTKTYVRVLPDPTNAANHGWVVHSAFPK